MEDLRQKVYDDRNILKKLGGYIPGWSGYQNKEMRRDADKLLRMYLARQFGDQRNRLNEISVQLASSGNLKAVGELERAAIKLQTLVDRLKTASYGHAGFFDALTVREDDLDAIYNYDNSLADGVTLLTNALSALSSTVTAKEGVDAAVAALIGNIDQVTLAYNGRQDVILKGR
ncbi:MAG: hypothetical protein HY783_06965 [Chloroflexi bacterium]|nr:hypothetical protein [Chloroflexota bacterium]